MGKQDLWQSDYFDDKRRFADMFNGTLFCGKQVICPKELEEADSKLVHHENSGEALSVIRDKVYKWKGKHISICVLENQSYVDYRMVLRVMMEEAISYIKQQKRIFKIRQEEGDTYKNNEFLSQMKKDEKFIPVITLVLYLGKEPWDGARNLYDVLEIDEELKCLVTNYRLNLFDYHDYQDYSQFETENRYVFELLSRSQEKDKMDEIIRKYLDDYILDKESMKTLFGMLGIRADINKYKKKTEEGVKYHLCKAWDDQKESGRHEGRLEGRLEGARPFIECICKKLRKGKDVTTIAEELDAEVSIIEKIYVTAQKFAPEYDAEKVLQEGNLYMMMGI